MSYSEKIKLDEFVDRLHDQVEVPLWVFASSASVTAIYNGDSEIFGPRGIWFRRLFNLFGLSYASELVLTVIGGMVSTFWLFRCRKVQQHFIDSSYFFIGFGAGPEKEMLNSFKAEVMAQVAHLNQTRPDSLAQVVRPKLSSIWRTSYRESQKTVRGLSRAATPIIREHAQHWLASAAIRFSTYIFLRSWADALPRHVKKIVFIAADIPAHALLDSAAAQRITVEYRQHGFLLKTLIFPPFHRLVALNDHEARHLAVRLPGATVIETSQNIQLRTTDNQGQLVLFASIYDHGSFRKHHHLSIIDGIIEWFSVKGLLTVVRQHPCESGDFWQKYCPTIKQDQTAGSFQMTLEALLPLFIVSWWSTALLDALKAGVLPIMIMEGSQSALDTMVFPLAEIALNWPRDLALIQSLIDDPAVYRKELAARQFAAFGVAA